MTNTFVAQAPDMYFLTHISIKTVSANILNGK